MAVNEQVEATAGFAGMVFPLPPKEYYGSYVSREANPRWALIEAFKEKGYPLTFEFHPQDASKELELRGYARVGSKYGRRYECDVSVYCDDTTQIPHLRSLEDVVEQTPEFKFLDLASDQAYYWQRVDILEKVATGDFTDPEVQQEIPEIESTQLSEDDIKATLALGYRNRQKVLLERNKSHEQFLAYEPILQQEIDQNLRELASLEGPSVLFETHPLNYPPMSAIRMREILSDLIPTAEPAEQILEQQYRKEFEPPISPL